MNSPKMPRTKITGSMKKTKVPSVPIYKTKQTDETAEIIFLSTKDNKDFYIEFPTKPRNWYRDNTGQMVTTFTIDLQDPQAVFRNFKRIYEGLTRWNADNAVFFTYKGDLVEYKQFKQLVLKDRYIALEFEWPNISETYFIITPWFKFEPSQPWARWAEFEFGRVLAETILLFRRHLGRPFAYLLATFMSVCLRCNALYLRCDSNRLSYLDRETESLRYRPFAPICSECHRKTLKTNRNSLYAILNQETEELEIRNARLSKKLKQAQMSPSLNDETDYESESDLDQTQIMSPEV